MKLVSRWLLTELSPESVKNAITGRPFSSFREQWAASFIAFLNRQRRSAGLSAITLDAELSRGCQAQAAQLVKDRAGAKEDASLLTEEVAEPLDALDSVDPVLEKISKHGMSSLTQSERATLERARASLLKRKGREP